MPRMPEIGNVKQEHTIGGHEKKKNTFVRFCRKRKKKGMDSEQVP